MFSTQSVFSERFVSLCVQQRSNFYTSVLLSSVIKSGHSLLRIQRFDALRLRAMASNTIKANVDCRLLREYVSTGWVVFGSISFQCE
jgi:hypothetical protein